MVQEGIDASSALDPGETLSGRYRIDRKLGEGDRKCTYLAEDLKVGDRLVALSVIKDHARALDPDGTIREANLLSRVSGHNHIVAFHDCELDGPRQYLVFEHLSGGTLADLIEGSSRENCAVPPETIVRVGRQIAGALSHIHRQGVVHRDVAPHNIWLASPNKAKLGDFDSAISISGSSEGRPITSEGFASPEERRGGVLDARSDLYSLGCVLISMARGEMRHADPERLRVERPELPAALTELLECLVADNPNDRPSAADEVVDALNTIRQGRDLYSIIREGEGPTIEFKASMRAPRGQIDLPESLTQAEREAALRKKHAELEKELEKAVLKTIAAFLNTEGGTLLIGVEDDGAIVGIEDDFATLSDKLGKDLDGWQLNLKDKVLSSLDADVWAVVRLTVERTSRGQVARIDCPARVQPTWLTVDDKQEFYVRAAAASVPLDPGRWPTYIKERWLA